jgi:hypothetical protein
MNTTTRIAITGALAAVAVAAAIPALTGAQTTGGRDITVREKVRAVAFVHPGSGAYAGASGTVTPGTPLKHYDGVDVLHVVGQ